MYFVVFPLYKPLKTTWKACSFLIVSYLITMGSETTMNRNYLIFTKLFEELPRGTLVENVSRYLSENTEGKWSFSDFAIVANNQKITKMLQLERNKGHIVTNKKIDRDTLCKKEKLCCHVNAQTSYANKLSTSNSLSHQRTTDNCQIVFRVIYKLCSATHESKHNLMAARYLSERNKNCTMGYSTILMELLDINDNQPHFVIPPTILQRSTDNFEIGMRCLSTRPFPSVEVWIDEMTESGSCVPLLTAIDEDSTKYGISEYRVEKVSNLERLQIIHSSNIPVSGTQGADDVELPFTVVLSDCKVSLWEKVTPNFHNAFTSSAETMQSQSSEDTRSLGLPLLKLIGKLDREVRDEYWLKVLALDGNIPSTLSRKDSSSDENNLYPDVRHTGTLIVRVRVRDANDNSPEAPPLMELRVQEDTPVGSVIGTVSATDGDIGDNGRLQFQLDVTPRDSQTFPFKINPSTGAILVHRELDADRINQEDNRRIQFKVITFDAGKPVSRSAITEVIVMILDINDETPQIKVVDLKSQSEPPRPMIEENLPPGQLIAFVTATDADSGLYGSLRCEVDNTKFQLESLKSVPELSVNFDNPSLMTIRSMLSKGQTNSLIEYKLITTAKLDRESTPFEVIVITCVDHSMTASDVRTGRARLTVTVLDENDNDPLFESDQLCLRIYENEPVNRLLTVFNVTDADHIWTNRWGTNVHEASMQSTVDSNTNRLRFTLDRVGEQFFRVDPMTGALYSKLHFDREETAEIHFNVTATDGDSPPRNSSVNVVVSILDRNDNAPKFAKDLFEIELREDLLTNTTIFIFAATDIDSGVNAELVYHLEDLQGVAQRHFQLDARNATLWLRSPLDREKEDRYTFKIYSTDGGYPKQSAFCTVHIRVLDVNDNAPKFIYPTQNNHTIFASVFTTPGVPLVKLTAVDPDEGVNAQLTFFIDGNPEHQKIFALNENSGELSLTNTKQPEANEGRFPLTLRVQDSGSPPLCGFATISIVLNRNIQYGYPVKTTATMKSLSSGINHATEISTPSLLSSILDIDPVMDLQPILSTDTSVSHSWSDSSSETFEESPSREQLVRKSVGSSSVYFTSERALIVIICLIAISALLAFIFLVVIMLIRRKFATTSSDQSRQIRFHPRGQLRSGETGGMKKVAGDENPERIYCASLPRSSAWIISEMKQCPSLSQHDYGYEVCSPMCPTFTDGREHLKLRLQAINNDLFKDGQAVSFPVNYLFLL
ncbi:protocadherin delta 1 [Paragonimus westermani]|uniref:Protocadherin delta 1 n=1 Tax=Paragonimus westermani TaxID=34504 RepID=A0A5J4NQA2_9TREM|nr:protocadherin delta 1 [Paragonimus westermani]